MEFYKKWWFWTILLLIAIIFFFPKSCGGAGGIGGLGTSIDCNCVGIKGPSLMNKYISDASITSCYGICLKSTCETIIIYPNGTRSLK